MRQTSMHHPRRTAAKQSWRLPLVLLGAWVVLLGLLAPPASAEEMRSRQWYLDRMQATRMWDITTGEGITVAVIDRGIDSSVPELTGQVLPGADFSQAQKGAHHDGSGHGTNMAMLIAGKRNQRGVWGLAPGTKILPVKLGSMNEIRDMERCIRYAADNGAQVISISMGGLTSNDETLQQLQSAINYAYRQGSLIFAATGNNGDEDNAPETPADRPGVIGVSAVNQSLTVAKFSTHGPQVALSAPGVDIPARCTETDGYCASDGTSSATALASASAALVWSAHPEWTNNQVLRVMMETAGKPKDGVVPSDYLGYGIVRPRKVLLDKEGDPGPANVHPLFPNHDFSAPSPSPSPSDAQSGSQDNNGSGTPQQGGSKAPAEPGAQAADNGSGGVPIWLVASGAGAAVLITAAAPILVRRRRTRF